MFSIVLVIVAAILVLLTIIFFRDGRRWLALILLILALLTGALAFWNDREIEDDGEESTPYSMPLSTPMT